ncbi:MAG: hypothetical protein M3N93_03985 [Acidobacteriota bacterium]|nr:hypothetical protein [Acidobacteriota bacterium]
MLRFDLAPGKTALVIAAISPHKSSDAASLKSAEILRRSQFRGTLPAAASQFIARRDSLRTVIAGYPWFTDWGRDTMISLPGLTLSTGRFDIARDILLEFAGLADQGLLPNAFPDRNQPPAGNTVDATLWFFEAVRRYLEASNDLTFVRAQLYEKLNEILDWHVKGTRYGIRMDSDGLIEAGDPTTQLTWMDARVGNQPVTPRNGKPVEIQALWYNALRFMQWLAHELGDEHRAAFCADLALHSSGSFNTEFRNDDAGYLYDVINGPRRDSSLRPNQLIALSLGYCAIPAGRAHRILSAVENNLLTPFGLRTLAPGDPQYKGRYEGPPAVRDAAYHQGTVWPWLLGPFIAADVRFRGEAARKRIPQLLSGLLEYAKNRGTGQVPEIFDGDAPHAPRGCFAQAWSVAEILRASAEF